VRTKFVDNAPEKMTLSADPDLIEKARQVASRTQNLNAAFREWLDPTHRARADVEATGSNGRLSHSTAGRKFSRKR